MMIIDKTKALLTMKIITALFLSFMFFKGVNVLCNMNTEEINEINNIQTDLDLCSNYYMFHIFAFVLGAFWNVKKIIKIGIV